jgi:hypothetical protein
MNSPTASATLCLCASENLFHQLYNPPLKTAMIILVGIMVSDFLSSEGGVVLSLVSFYTTDYQKQTFVLKKTPTCHTFRVKGINYCPNVIL